jgi:lincosamide nucleotidyltransferase A/C/D/E
MCRPPEWKGCAEPPATSSVQRSAGSLTALSRRSGAHATLRRVVDLAAALAALDCLEDQGITTWVDGGRGIDALVGEQTRPHEDLDLVVAQGTLAAAQSALRALGYRHDATVEPGLPARLVLLDSDRRHIDLHPVVFDAHGNGWQPLGDGAWGGYPAEGLTGVGIIGGRRVRCLTPQLQLRHHLGYPPDNNDRHDVRLLAEHFGLCLPPDF